MSGESAGGGIPSRSRHRKAPRAAPASGVVWWLLSAAAVAYGVIAALRRLWWCDDAFISFRYAENLNVGLGLVYNVGERVEGYSNLLWTLWIALGMRLGVSPETWSAAWGIAFFASTIALLCWLQRRDARARGVARLGLPIAGLLMAAHRDASVFATSGLETSLVTFLAVAAYGLAVESGLGSRGAAASGLAAALAALTRPDGLLFAPFLGAYLLWTRRPRGRALAAFAVAFSAIWLPVVLWRVSYYGDFFPNTYYAKSAWMAWYGQGLIYLRLYAQQYWMVLAGLPVAIVALVLFRPRDRAWTSRVVLAAGIAVAYTAYVVRVGGDFMYARLLLPATPFFLILLESGLSVLSKGARLEAGATAALVVLELASPTPFRGKDGPAGIANEPLYYPPGDLETQRKQGATLRRYFEGTPVSVAYHAAQARLVYYARPAVAIECATGLTDHWIAHQTITQRGRVGHEKPATVPYLLRRHVDFTLGYEGADALHLGDYVPWVRIWFDDVPGNLVRWDPAILDEMARRGARFPDVPRHLAGYGAAIDSIPIEQVRNDYTRFRRFYFEYANDSLREAPFLVRLAPRNRRPSP